jgi:hypothetical protein
MSSNCSPLVRNNKTEYSCLSAEKIKKLGGMWNKHNPSDRIMAQTPKEIYDALTLRLQDRCSSEACWLKQKDEFGNEIGDDLEDTFMPDKPKSWMKNPNEWLSSTEIKKVMELYEKAYPHFDFIGPTPIDFDSHSTYNSSECVWEELCKFNLQKMINKGKTDIGIIYNTDPHTKGGQHWISMYIDIPEKTIFFFDSTGDKAQPEIEQFVKRVQEQGKQMGIEMKYDTSEGISHQRGDTECGMYSLYFIVQVLENKLDEEQLKNKSKRITDKEMENQRNVLFNNS